MAVEDIIDYRHIVVGNPFADMHIKSIFQTRHILSQFNALQNLFCLM